MAEIRSRATAVAAAAVLVAGALVWTQSASAAPSGRHGLAGSVPPWATAAAKVGEASGSDNVGFRVYLGWRDAGGAEALATAVSTPGSASYGKYVTAAKFRGQFAPSASDVSAVQQWLRKAGFDIGVTPGNNRYVQAEGTVAQAAAAFGAKFGVYKVAGQTLRAPESELSVPSTLPSSITAVIGLDESSALTKPDAQSPDATPSPAFVNAPPCSAYWNEKNTATTLTPDGTKAPDAYGHPNPWAVCGHTPAQLRSAYGVAGAGNDGTGQTVAIIDAYASPTIVADVNEYSSRHGLPKLTGSTFSQVTPPGVFNRPQNRRQDPQGWYGEETLDVEAVHGVAPGAKIVYVGAPNNYQDLDAAMNHVVDQHLASIVTNSYGFSTELLPTGYVKPLNDTLIEAAATGIGVYFSSGDDGDHTGGNPANASHATPDWPAVSPWVTAVGGTALAVGAAGNYLFETGWETGRSDLSGGVWSPTPPGDYTGGSGGGTSRLFTQPAYQKGVVPNAIATANGTRPQPMRAVPDVAAIGDPNTGYLIGQTQAFPDGTSRYSEYRIGGTSLSSPVYAGLMAIAQQKAGHDIGFANPLLYSKAGSSAYHDIVPPAAPIAVARNNYTNSVDASGGTFVSLRTLGFDSGLTIHVRPGYDDVTGVGSPNGAAWLNALSQ
ncbi:S53 family peptidase [Kribbella sp. NPDC051137]|uniref:S53 family peptidase n=1 Tax=Kribbella sp. NPDC051137 TaxID=3155045 RepID=UPI0034293068